MTPHRTRTTGLTALASTRVTRDMRERIDEVGDRLPASPRTRGPRGRRAAAVRHLLSVALRLADDDPDTFARLGSDP